MLTERPRTRLSVVLAVVQAVLAALHTNSALVYPAQPTTTTVVVTVNRLGPWWLIAFAVSATLLLVTLYRSRHRQFGHLACATVWMAYTVALWWGAVATGGPVALAVLATGFLVIHLVIATAYADRRD